MPLFIVVIAKIMEVSSPVLYQIVREGDDSKGPITSMMREIKDCNGNFVLPH